MLFRSDPFFLKEVYAYYSSFYYSDPQPWKSYISAFSLQIIRTFSGRGRIAIMRFRRGSRVEVLDRKELSLGSWRCGEIISVNRHSCTVRYYSQNRKNTLAKISSSAIRPCQPHLGNPKKWIPGDVMEVFNDFSWKMGKVINSLGRTSYVVQILGTSEQCRVHLSKTRLRRSWHNGRWIVIGQVNHYSLGLPLYHPTISLI